MGNVKSLRQVSVASIKPYENNAKIHDAKQIELLANSIERFGFLTPCIIDRDNNLIAGHGRLQATLHLGLEKIPCVSVESLTEEERKAYILADNRLSEFGSWDMDLVNQELAELQGLDFDIDVSGFELPDMDENESGWYGDERERTFSAYNMDIAEVLDKTADFWQMPIIQKTEHIPDHLIGFNYALTSKDKDAGIHFFLDDYQFERVWNAPDKYLYTLGEYDCILTPDFSLYSNMDMPTKIWNTYRSRLIGAYYQRFDIEVIPTVSWAEAATFDFCFLGIEKGGTVAISTIGVKEEENAAQMWHDGVDAMIRALEPSTILVYGGKIEHDFGEIEVKWYDNEVLKNWR